MTRIENTKPVSWERVRAIFGNAHPPPIVIERQFDYGDDELKQLAKTPYQEIDSGDLWYYFHDLAYVELQPDLFNYLFPVCLMDWHRTLIENESCSHGDAEFHKALRRGNVLEKMLTPRQRTEVVEFFRMSFLERLDAEPVSVEPGIAKHPFRWIYRFNSLGFVVPRIESIWESWWSMATRGRAIAVLKYCSGLAYLEGDNRLFGHEVNGRGWLGPYLWEHDSYIHDQSWLEPNIDFLREVLTLDYVTRKVAEATDRLLHEPEHSLAERLSTDIVTNRVLVESRVSELPRLLSGERLLEDGWSI